MNKKTEKKIAKLTAEMEKHDENIKDILSQLEEMLKEVKKRGFNHADDYYTVATNISAAGVRMMQEALLNTRLSFQHMMLNTNIVNVENGEEAKEYIDNMKKKYGKEEDMGGCKDGKKKPCTGKKCGGGKKCGK